ncbi:hypothetical protein C2G38_2250075 [Gigaspora rosea]|uniref:Uncharacterized protein n=1 Tax=Gigaspora rosea TaxID=44941 RepID=A0A397UQU3_9GLOM|nr:hypothetical protein C2G38_2250075 [Gigaspora rosea]
MSTNDNTTPNTNTTTTPKTNDTTTFKTNNSTITITNDTTPRTNDSNTFKTNNNNASKNNNKMPTIPILQRTFIMTFQYHLILNLVLFLFKLDDKPISYFMDIEISSTILLMVFKSNSICSNQNNYDP